MALKGTLSQRRLPECSPKQLPHYVEDLENVGFFLNCAPCSKLKEVGMDQDGEPRGPYEPQVMHATAATLALQPRLSLARSLQR